MKIPTLNFQEPELRSPRKTTPSRSTVRRSVNNAASLILLVTALTSTLSSRAAEAGTPAPANQSLRHEVQRAIDRGAAWIVKSQSTNGAWSTVDHPAVTALALVALQGDSTGAADVSRKETLTKGYAFLRSCVQSDGGIYGAKQELVNYNTAVSTMAFLTARQPDYKPTILKARQFLIDSQIDFDKPGTNDNVLDGGIGYGSKYKHSDMGNTLAALEAIYYSRQLAQDERLAGARDLNWAAAIQFIQNCQNLPSHNKQAWASADPANKGGFVYYPGHSMAGTNMLTDGRVALRSYGSISYGGMLSYAYAELKKDDPRVSAVHDWLRSNFTLEENPGMGQQGLFFYFHTMTKALNIHGIDVLEASDGRKIHWREQLALKLMNLQRTDGSWSNASARWWENDPVLVTSYALISLEMLREKL
ncbi:MAG: cycloartenol synthase [Pedosphaera sp.]|nr:cycloartenol synthase [Pedosphaera sp.]